MSLFAIRLIWPNVGESFMQSPNIRKIKGWLSAVLTAVLALTTLTLGAPAAHAVTWAAWGNDPNFFSGAVPRTQHL